ncbi:MAG: hypothetical protein KF696_13010 [Planctomycetes bacterium]|nr:hypothetical protein [Planctomycetota bacterium]MCW8136009.1 hypothetical protein [Planctomycetota bacterium]
MYRTIPMLALLMLLGACGPGTTNKPANSEPTPAPQPAAALITAKRVAEAGPALAPDSGAFDSAPAVTVNLLPQIVVVPMNQKTSVGEISARAVHDGKWLTIRLDWADATLNDAPGIDKFEDMVALQLPRKPGSTPNIMMGDANNPVVVLQWRAGRQAAIDRGERPESRHAYPNMNKDIDIADLVGSEKGSPYRGAMHVNNPVSLPDLDRSPVLAQVAAGYSTLSGYTGRIAEGRGVHNGARWLVTIHIPLGGDNEMVPGLAPGAKSLLAFAVWDGEFSERGSRKSWSPNWTPIELAN